MTRRLPAPPPAGSPDGRGPPSAPPEPAAPVEEPGDEDWDEPLDDDWDQPDAVVPDDADPGDLVFDDPAELDALDPLDGPDDDEPLADPLDAELDEQLVDLAAPEDHELPILTLTPRARVDGESVPARLDPLAPASTWRGAPFRGERDVVLELGGQRISTRLRASEGEPELILGRDILAGRFLLRL